MYVELCYVLEFIEFFKFYRLVIVKCYKIVFDFLFVIQFVIWYQWVFLEVNLVKIEIKIFNKLE